jgi:hypothetical protein
MLKTLTAEDEVEEGLWNVGFFLHIDATNRLSVLHRITRHPLVLWWFGTFYKLRIIHMGPCHMNTGINATVRICIVLSPLVCSLTNWRVVTPGYKVAGSWRVVTRSYKVTGSWCFALWSSTMKRYSVIIQKLDWRPNETTLHCFILASSCPRGSSWGQAEAEGLLKLL